MPRPNSLISKSCIIPLACLLLLAKTCAAQRPGWAYFQVDKRVTVNFPKTVREMDIPRTMAAADAPAATTPQVLTSRGFKAEDEVAIYLLICIPLKEVPALPPTFTERANYYRTHTIPLLVAHARGVLMGQEISSAGGLDLITVKYQVLGPTGSPTVKYLRMTTVGRMIYQLFFVPKDRVGTTSATQRIRFFDSFRVGPIKAHQNTPLKHSRQQATTPKP